MLPVSILSPVKLLFVLYFQIFIIVVVVVVVVVVIIIIIIIIISNFSLLIF
jgi:hypothetical protein